MYFDLLITYMIMKISAKDIFKVKTQKTYFLRFSYYFNKYWYERKIF